jgi:hypothetical protein
VAPNNQKTKDADHPVVPAMEDDPLLTPEELIAQLVTDITTNSAPDDLVEDFIDNFVTVERPETAQLLGLLDGAPESVVELLKTYLATSYQAGVSALDTNGVAFLRSLKERLTLRMTQLAEEAD